MSKRITLAIVNPDGTEQTVALDVDQTATIVQAFTVTHDRYHLDGTVNVIVRRVT